MEVKSELEMTREILEEFRKDNLRTEINLEYLKIQSIGNPKNDNLAGAVRKTEEILENNKVLLRIILRRIGELEKKGGAN